MRLNFRYSLNKHLLFQRANANTERERERGRAWNMTKYQHHFFDWPFVCFDFISHFVPCIFSLMHDSSFSYADRYSELFCTYDIVFSCIFFCFFFRFALLLCHIIVVDAGLPFICISSIKQNFSIYSNSFDWLCIPSEVDSMTIHLTFLSLF